MAANISPLLLPVNKWAFLTSNKPANIVYPMRYGERLKAARGQMKQAKLSELSGVSQPLISQLENSETATGSEYTPRLARALKISVDWLADEIGEMIPQYETVTDPRIVALVRMLQQEEAPYLVEKIQKDLAADIELMRAATAQAKANDC
jgi:transcriptional regulator with XRE-family HTH domain